jgi:hypothetical protein
MRNRLKDASAIGIIGGSDGPTTIFVGPPHAEAQWQRTLEKCKCIAEPRETRVTGDELVWYLMEEYGAYEVPVSRGKCLALKISVVLNHHSEAFGQPPMPPQNASRNEWKKWAEQSQLNIDAARAVPDEQYGLRYKFLAIPRTEKTEKFYVDAEREQVETNKRFKYRLAKRKARNVRARKMVFGIELSTGYCQLDDGGSALMNEVVLWRGVTRADIEAETPAFLAYAAAMRDTGRL